MKPYLASSTGVRRWLPYAVLLAGAVSVQPCFGQVKRTDKLECVVADGSRFLLESRYHWRVLPIPGYPNRESERRGWTIQYRDRAGHVSDLPIGTEFENRQTQHLINTCSLFGLWNGIPVGPYTYLQRDGRWRPHKPSAFQWDQLNVDFREIASPAVAARAAALRPFGISRAANDFAYIVGDGRKLIYEQPLHKAVSGYIFDLFIDAVYQAFSDDDGKTWSNGVLTTTPRLFEIGKSRIQQTMRARPDMFNGKRVVLPSGAN